MSEHHLKPPRRGGVWQQDAATKGLLHRDGNPWCEVRTPFRSHRCLAQSELVWTMDTRPGNHVAAIRWCACGAVTYPAAAGRWLGRNIRRRYSGAPLPAWHRAMTDLCNGPAAARTRPQSDDTSDHVTHPSTSRAAVETPSHPPPPAARPPRSTFPSTSEHHGPFVRQDHRTNRAASGAAVVRPLIPAVEPTPSHAWSLKRLHWHGFATPAATPVVLWAPPAVADWVVAVTGLRDLHQQVVTAAANGDLVRVGTVVAEPTTTDCCAFRCVA